MPILKKMPHWGTQTSCVAQVQLQPLSQLAAVSHLCGVGLFFAGILGKFPCLLSYEWGFADLDSGFRAMGARRSGFEARLVFEIGF